MRRLLRGLGVACAAATIVVVLPVSSIGSPARGMVAGPAARPMLDPTLIYDFPASPVHVTPGQSWTLPARVNQDVGGRPAYLQRQVGKTWVTIDRMRAKRYRLAFSVREPRAGTFRYRIVVPVHGGFEARTSKVQVVLVGPMTDANRQDFVPTAISGSFSGQDIAWGVTRMSWSGTITMQLISYREAGLSDSVYYRPTTLSATWASDYTDFQNCHITGSGTLGQSDVTYSELGNGIPELWVSAGRAVNEYGFDLRPSRDAVLSGFRTCPGAEPQPYVFTSSMGALLDASADSYVDRAPQRLEYVPGLPEAGWVRFVGRTQTGSWDLMGSGHAPFIRPRP